MFGIFTGVIVNTLTVIAGSLVGLLAKNEKLKNIGEAVFSAFAFFVIAMGVNGAADMDDPVLIILCIFIGVTLGTVLNIDGAFMKLSGFLQTKLARGKGDASFAENFVMALCLFCIGSMTFLGAMEAALEGTHTIYYTKSVMDGISAMTLAMGGGLGILFSAIGVFVYQGLLVLGASFLAPILTAESIAASSVIGSLILIAIGLNMLNVTKIKAANFLPAMFIPFFWQAIQLIL